MSIHTESSDKQLLNQLRAGDNQAFTQLYRQCYPSIEHFVLKNNGNPDQAKDLFQDTLLVLIATIDNPTFQLTSSFKTYVFSISKHLWLKQLKRAARWTNIEEADETGTVAATTELDIPPTAYETVMSIMVKLTFRCMKLLSAIFFGRKDIADIMNDEGYASVHSAQNQKYKCLQQARKVGGKMDR